MKPSEKEILALLARLDERTLNLWHIISESDDSLCKKIDQIRQHQISQNGAILKNTIYRKIMVGVGGTAITAFILHLIGIY
jgi:hypothetical protein